MSPTFPATTAQEYSIFDVGAPSRRELGENGPSPGAGEGNEKVDKLTGSRQNGGIQRRMRDIGEKKILGIRVASIWISFVVLIAIVAIGGIFAAFVRLVSKSRDTTNLGTGISPPPNMMRNRTRTHMHSTTGTSRPFTLSDSNISPVSTTPVTSSSLTTESLISTTFSTMTSVSPTISFTAAAVSTSASSIDSNNQVNLQTFNGALGGVPASPITNSDDPSQPFQVDSVNFNALQDAVMRSCTDQFNNCTDIAASPDPQGIAASDCVDQQDDCIASIPTATEPASAPTSTSF